MGIMAPPISPTFAKVSLVDSEPMRITISENTYQLIKDDFSCTERGEFEVKGFGMNKLYYLDRELHPDR